MNRMRLLGTCLTLGGVVLLGGCATYPAGSYGYADPYYVDPSPVYVQPNVYIDGSYYSRPRYPYYGRPGYYGPRSGYGPRRDHGQRPDYDGPRPGHGPRPSAGAPSPRAATAPLVRDIQRSAPAARQPPRQDNQNNLP
jgi:hypothetical protein